jgi:hypothetical protein
MPTDARAVGSHDPDGFKPLRFGRTKPVAAIYAGNASVEQKNQLDSCCDAE